MSDELRLSCVQPRSTDDLGQVAEERAALIRAVESDVVVFPELSLTGYWLGAEAVELRDPRLAPVVQACADTGATALVGAPVKGDRSAEHVATLAVDIEGLRIAYRKIHLDQDEARRFSPGPEPAVIEMRGWRLGLAICRDTGIVAHAEATARLGIDAYLAGVVDLPADAEVQLERGRRIVRSHGVWVGIASCAGQAGSGFGETAGRSFILSPDGEIVDRAGPEAGQTARATLRRP